jgi:uncharacterized protein
MRLPEPEWTPAQAEALSAALARGGGMSYCELAGFLFALACAPEMIKPSEWIADMLGERGALASVAEAQRMLDLAMALHNRINFEVMERKPALPAGIEVHANAMKNLGPKAPLGQWAAGFGAGQLRAERAWDKCLREEGSGETLDGALGGLNAALTFFTHRELAEKWRARMPGKPSLEEAARQALVTLPAAMGALAELGRGMEEARRARARAPARSAKTGRNVPCPCGSGRKYKHCCGAPA